MKPKLVSVCLILLFATSLARAQTTKETRNRNYQQLFAMTDGFFAKLPKTCKTDVCAQLAIDGAKLVSEGRDKHARGVLIDEERNAWHAKLETTMLRSINELQAGIARKRGMLSPIPTAALKPPVCLKPVQGSGGDQCQLCYDVMEQAAEICALYAFVSPEAALICLGWATLNFGGCINRYCDPYFNTN